MFFKEKSYSYLPCLLVLANITSYSLVCRFSFEAASLFF